MLCTQSGINLGSPDIVNAYNAVRNGTSSWAVFTLNAKDELKLEEQGYKDSTLDDMKDEFSDGKCVIMAVNSAKVPKYQELMDGRSPTCTECSLHSPESSTKLQSSRSLSP